jgi:nitrate/nitrite transport system substrate-binding protein
MPSLYTEAMKELGYKHGGEDNSACTFFDGGTFDPAKAAAYGTGFKVHSMKA